MPPEQAKTSDRTSYYTMKTSGRPMSGSSHTHTHSHSQSFFPKTSTPMASPRQPFSVGQPNPPKLSPGASRVVTSQEVRSPSPNYFGLSIESPHESPLLPRENWSPPTSSVKSFAAAIPKQLPLDANPEFEAFRRQVDANRGGTGFRLSTSHFSITGGGPQTLSMPASTPSALQRPRPPRWNTLGSETAAGDAFQLRAPPLKTGNPITGNPITGNPITGNPITGNPITGNLKAKEAPGGRTDGEYFPEGLEDSAYVSAESKRNSEASLEPPSFFNMGRRESPAQFDSPFAAPDLRRSHFSISGVDDRHPRLSMTHGKADPPSPQPAKQQQQRADTLPQKLETGGPSMMSPSQLRDLIENGQGSDQVLLLDIRVSPQYAQSRIKGALNLCIPTTLLKRATFNLQKLQQTFQAEQDQERFANWRKASYLVVYDAFSSDKRDAVSAMNMLKKFTNEGYSGSANILRGGFNAFAAAYPDLVDSDSGGPPPNASLSVGPASNGGARPNVPPVIGGVLLPMPGSNPNPFFSNIRQNQDLVDGVGQMDVSVPSGLDKGCLPRWLREAAETSDHGKKVSDKFLHIEMTEQSRMRDAYSISNTVEGGREKQDQIKMQQTRVQLSGIEKGGKNRYKDILPFEHARVRLLGRPDGACDYVNASHIQASRSHKRYIASQGPLPATFEDFWSVIWDQDVRVIVMLTAESEGGQLKCHPYWKGKDYGPIRLRCLSEKKVSLDLDKRRPNSTAGPSSTSDVPNSAAPRSTQGSFPQDNPFSRDTASQSADAGRRRANTTTTLGAGAPTAAQQTNGAGIAETPYVIIRKFALSHTAHPFSPIREVTHLHYPSWPDFGAPAQPSHLLALVELANMMQHAALPVDVSGADSNSPHASWHDVPESNEQARPMLVHCSAGCGRTGTFCTVDSVIDMLKRQRLRAVKQANKRIAGRDRRAASQQQLDERAKRARHRRDTDGDLTMDDDQADVDEINPLSASRVPTPASAPDSATHSEDEKDAAEKGMETSWLDDDSIDLVAGTVEDFRGQRLSMVQSLRQFVLCYETVTEWIWRSQQRSGGGKPAVGRARSGSLAIYM